MVKPIHPIALFRYGILGPLVSRDRLASGELTEILKALSAKIYQTPEGKSVRYSYKALEVYTLSLPHIFVGWYYCVKLKVPYFEKGSGLFFALFDTCAIRQRCGVMIWCILEPLDYAR